MTRMVMAWKSPRPYAVATGGHRAGVLESSFIAEVKSDLMGEQTILCGMLQTGTLLCFDKMVEKGYGPRLTQPSFVSMAGKLSPKALKHGGITNMMDRLVQSSQDRRQFPGGRAEGNYGDPVPDAIWTTSSPASSLPTMIEDWAHDDKNLLTWREETA